ncbi:type VII secretion integral membrane protein EccD [Mycolicibacterium sp.]|uniref:type VII secretion integral membrane protein EccD n=1 Tax=Mycolicibacterium sp. TaxID=2320850 RepID=UPI003D11F3BC
MTDLVLPSAVPIETYIDETVAVLGELLADAPSEALAGFDFGAQGQWSFARPGGPPIKPTESLTDAGVVDGALLIAVPVSRTERYRPLVEDVIDAIAVVDEAPRFDRRALYGFIAVVLPCATLTTACVAAISWAATERHWWWAVALVLLGSALAAGSRLVQNRHGDLDMAESLLASSLLTLSVGVALAIPLPRAVDSLGAPQIAGAGALVFLFALVTRGGPRGRATIATFLAVAAAAATLAAVAFGYGWGSWVPAGAIAFGLMAVTNAAKLTVAVARIALPPIPAPGEAVSSDELLDPVEMAADTESAETWQAIIASVPDSAVRLSERSVLARQLLIGFLTAGACISSIGAVAVVVRGHFFVHGLVVAGLVTIVCGFRSRLYAERWCAWALMAAAVAVPAGLMVRLCLWYPGCSWLPLALYTGLALVAMIVVAATDGVRRVSPIARRVLELVDGAAIAAIIPLLLWTAGVYDLLRNLRL